MQIFQTEEYGMFTFPMSGRPLVESVINKKVDWVNQPKDGRHRRLALVEVELGTNPIQVNKDMLILEGKNRFEILRRLKLPISYIIVEIVR